jgi:integrase
MDFATDKYPSERIGPRSRPLEKRLAKTRRAGLAVEGRVQSMTLGNYMLKRWLPLIETGLEPCTSSSYRAMTQMYVLPHIGAVRVGRLDRNIVQAFYTELLHHRSERTGRPLSKETVIRIHCILHSALQDLVQSGQLASNPARGLRPRRVKSERYEYRIWTHAQLEEFLKDSAGHWLFALWRVLAYTGMRRGEAIALKCADLRLKQNQLAVRRALGTADREIYVTRPKTDAERVIELDHETVRILRGHLRSNRLKESSDEWLFADDDGGPLRPTNVSHWFQELLRKTDLPRIRLHDLRHTHASHLILAGANMKAVQERLGHADLMVTLNIYSHVLPTTQREAIRQLERFYRS